MLENVSIVLNLSFRGKYYKSIMNKSWVSENCDFVFSTDDILIMVWARPGIIKLILLLY